MNVEAGCESGGWRPVLILSGSPRRRRCVAARTVETSCREAMVLETDGIVRHSWAARVASWGRASAVVLPADSVSPAQDEDARTPLASGRRAPQLRRSCVSRYLCSRQWHGDVPLYTIGEARLTPWRVAEGDVEACMERRGSSKAEPSIASFRRSGLFSIGSYRLPWRQSAPGGGGPIPEQSRGYRCEMAGKSGVILTRAGCGECACSQAWRRR